MHTDGGPTFALADTRYLKGAGSVLCEQLARDAPTPVDKSLAALQPLAPRFFAAREIANLHGFPDAFAPDRYPNFGVVAAAPGVRRLTGCTRQRRPFRPT